MASDAPSQGPPELPQSPSFSAYALMYKASGAVGGALSSMVTAAVCYGVLIGYETFRHIGQQLELALQSIESALELAIGFGFIGAVIGSVFGYFLLMLTIAWPLLRHPIRAGNDCQFSWPFSLEAGRCAVILGC